MRNDLEDVIAWNLKTQNGRWGHVRFTLSSSWIMDVRSPTVQFLDTNGDDRDVFLPPLDRSGAQYYLIGNIGSESLTVYSSFGVRVTDVGPDDIVLFVSSTSEWRYIKANPNAITAARRVNTGDSLVGGGDLTTDLTISLDPTLKAWTKGSGTDIQYTGNVEVVDGQFNITSSNPILKLIGTEDSAKPFGVAEYQGLVSFDWLGNATMMSMDLNTGNIILAGSNVGGKVTVGFLGSTTRTWDLNGNVGLAADSYLNWGATDGSTGYGLRENSGILEAKNNGGVWQPVTAFTQSGTGAVQDTVQEELKRIWDVRQFGVVNDSDGYTSGNGTDNTAKLQAIIDAMPAEGGILYGIAIGGSCRITGPIEITKPIIIQGPGWKMTGSIFASVTGLFTDFDPVDDTTAALLISHTGVTIRNLLFRARQTTPVAQTVTFSTGTPGTVNWNNHGFAAGTALCFSNVGGTLPAALNPDFNYFVLATGNVTNAFQISGAPGAAAIALADTGTGTHYCGTFKAKQNPWAIRTTRVPYHDEGGNYVHIKDVMIFNHSHGIFLDGTLATFINGVTGQPLSVGIKCLQQFDVCRIQNVHFTPLYGALVNATIFQTLINGNQWAVGGNSTTAWNSQNTIGLWLGRCDNFNISDWFSYSFWINWLIDAETQDDPTGRQAGTVSRLLANNIGFDGATFGIKCQANGATGQITNLYVAGSGQLDPASNDTYGVLIGNNNGTWFHFANLRVTNPDYSIRVFGNTGNDPNIIHISGLMIDDTHYSRGKTNALISVDEQSYVNATNVYLVPKSGGLEAGGNVCLPYTMKKIEVAAASKISLTSGVTINLGSLSLEAGVWDVYFDAIFTPASTTTISVLDVSISNASATLNETPGYVSYFGAGGAALNPTNLLVKAGPVRITVTSTQTWYATVVGVFGTSTCAVWGGLYARRVT